MEKDLKLIEVKYIQNKIYTIRNEQIMIDSDLAELYGVETRVLNQAVKRNIDRFPVKFRFQLTREEASSIKSQNVILENENEALRSQNVILDKGRGKHRKYLPYAFTEQGVAMLSAVLNSDTAVQVSIKIIDAFVMMRRFLSSNAAIFNRMDSVEKNLLEYKTVSDSKFNKIFEAIEQKQIKPKQGIFYEGQIFDAYKFVSDLFRSAKNTIIIIDNYIDDSVLTHLSKKKKSVEVMIYTKNLSAQLKLDAEKFNSQYKNLTLKKFNKSHDRFIIIDNKDIYHFGASLKDLGKKWFAFSKFEKEALKILEKLD
ncbi:MAG: ORF6N domain-containing protein [Candidatus Atribacteria bacterium]|nr:ORF6N domain-containing protein [Candidatus Atribacteria bacterium]